ncbi:MAG: TAXI family TRAP transporter solute-binding subunit [Tissierellia bacterium]|nr:TAXI family TRAP transporter solute-binding subunit [Tissierellia bacterium]
MKKWLSVLIFLLLTTGCKTSVGKIPVDIPTAGTTGALYPLGASLAYVWNREIDEIKASSQSSNGGIENLNLIYEGEADVSLGVTSIVYQAFNGTDKFEGRQNQKLRIITGLYYNPNQIVVSNKSKIQSLQELKGHSFAPGSPGSTTEDETKIHFDAFGMDYPQDIDAVYIGPSEASDLIRNRSLDGLWVMAGVPTASVNELITTADCHLLPISKEEVDILKEKYPWYASYTIPADTYKNQSEDIETSAIKMVLYTTTDMDEEVVYQLTKTFWENIEELKSTNKSLSSVTIEDAVTDISNLPLHKGSEKYYREIGLIP